MREESSFSQSVLEPGPKYTNPLVGDRDSEIWLQGEDDSANIKISKLEQNIKWMSQKDQELITQI